MGDRGRFHKDHVVTRSIAVSSLRWLLEQNVMARQQGVAWVCYILISTCGAVEKFVRKNISLNGCGKKVVVRDRELDRFRDSDNPHHNREMCGQFGMLGPSLLKE